MRTAIKTSLSAQKQALHAHKSQQRILTSISDAFGALDVHWRFIYANPSLASLAARTPEELVGGEVWGMIPAFCEPGPKQALERALKTQTSATFEMFVPRVNRWYETSVYPLESGLSLCSRDITARREAERSRVQGTRYGPPPARQRRRGRGTVRQGRGPGFESVSDYPRGARRTPRRARRMPSARTRACRPWAPRYCRGRSDPEPQ